MAVAPSRMLPPSPTASVQIPLRCSDGRRVFEVATEGLVCRDILHVRSASCVGAYLDMLRASCRGSVTYFLPFYIVHFIWHGKKALALDRRFYRELLIQYVRSIVFGTFMGSTFTLTSCQMVRLVGRYTYWTSILIPGTVAGLALIIDHPNRRKIVINTWLNMTLQYLYTRALIARKARRPLVGETVVFMAVNSLLLFLLVTARASARAGPRPTPSIFWFYTPEKLKENSHIPPAPGQCHCPVRHGGPCWKSASQSTVRYLILAAAVQALRVGVSVFRSSDATRPSAYLRRFTSLQTLSGMTSIGGYVFLYKTIRCALARIHKKDCPSHTAQAGFVAGAAYWLQPNTTILTSAMVATATLLYDRIPKERRPSEKWQLPILLFAVCNGILFHARCMDMRNCPQFIVHMMDTATRNRSNTIYKAYMHRVALLGIS